MDQCFLHTLQDSPNLDGKDEKKLETPLAKKSHAEHNLHNIKFLLDIN